MLSYSKLTQKVKQIIVSKSNKLWSVLKIQNKAYNKKVIEYYLN